MGRYHGDVSNVEECAKLLIYYADKSGENQGRLQYGGERQTARATSVERNDHQAVCLSMHRATWKIRDERLYRIDINRWILKKEMIVILLKKTPTKKRRRRPQTNDLARPNSNTHCVAVRDVEEKKMIIIHFLVLFSADFWAPGIPVLLMCPLEAKIP